MTAKTLAEPADARAHGTRDRYRYGARGRRADHGCRCGLCCEANSLYERYQAKRLPVQAAVDFLNASGVSIRAVGLRTGINIHRYIRAGTVTATVADRLAVVALRAHPVQVWGTAWLTDEADVVDLERTA